MSSPLKIHILGCHSATPKANAFPTAQVVEIRSQLILVDCGEGTQVRLRQNRIKFNQIKHILISHLHGDHFYGLIGFLSTLSLLNRQAPLQIFAPKGAEEIIRLQLKLSKSYLSYPLKIQALESSASETIIDNSKFTVKTIPLDHRVYTNGFLIIEKAGDRKLNIDKAEQYPIDKAYYKKIVKGADIVLDDGRRIPNEELTFPAELPKSYAYCSDTAFKLDIVPIIRKATALYHESTFLEINEDLCAKTKHSTAKQAGIIASKAEVGHLILGHYSARYKNLNAFKTEAESVFNPVSLAESGKTFVF
ncbi:ribonuclease Z [Mesohalobacter halotolerans]|uniref:Ribonuclease Z n=1 Tax=Mesohalobacter halotolerans TaxID=1883405 RepID=A0A4U5TNG0_9FLAO|nr:ribonuclease Z [Mesohalobacter halotolerans]MBS3737883.1 ribonuclease Z [Psychroflexus sp.]TKS55497.1 ribonuclease Z [Mesohalobacter halotolerans]